MSSEDRLEEECKRSAQRVDSHARRTEQLVKRPGIVAVRSRKERGRRREVDVVDEMWEEFMIMK